MSVIFISDNHISTVLRYVELNSNQKRNPFFGLMPSRKELICLGETIRDLNHQAFVNRYPNDEHYREKFTYKTSEKNDKFIDCKVNELYFKKLLDFIRYNIDEANETTQKKDFLDKLDSWEQAVLTNIVFYREAPWGID